MFLHKAAELVFSEDQFTQAPATAVSLELPNLRAAAQHPKRRY